MTGRDRLTVRLCGGGPWGFRLQGGAGTELPLTVAKVRRKSKSYKNLYEGDLIVSVNGRSCDGLTYDQVMEIADRSGSELAIEIVRGGANKENVAPENKVTSSPGKTLTMSSVGQPSEKMTMKKEFVTMTESRTKVTEESDGMRIKSISLLPETPMFLQQSEGSRLSERIESFETKPQPSNTIFSESQFSTSPLPTNTQQQVSSVSAPGDTSTKSVSQEVTSDDKKFEKTTTETVHEKHGNTETKIVKKEHESIIKDGGTTISPMPPFLNGHVPSIPFSSPMDTTVQVPSSAVSTEESRSFSSVESRTSETSQVYQMKQIETQKKTTSETSRTMTEIPDLSADIKDLIFSASEKMPPETQDTGKKIPPPPPPKPKIRPFSDPCLDRFLDHTDNVTLLPQTKMETDFTGTRSVDNSLFESTDHPFESVFVARKKKMFSSSSFYEEPHAIYPTVEEQVELARKIADSLSDDTNKKSKGANMFFKRVKKSTKWVHEGPEQSDDSAPVTPEIPGEPPTPDISQVPWKSHKGIPQLKLVLDPRHIQNAITLRSAGQVISEHNVVSPDVCHDLVRDLESPVGKGAALFAKRKKKSAEWIVDEEKVRSHMKTPEPVPEPAVPSFNKLQERINPKLKLVKTPWEAALESPIGSCDAAFMEVKRSAIADSVIRAAENKMGDSLMSSPPPEMETCRSPPIPITPAAAHFDIYKAKAPRGWVGTPPPPVSSSSPSLQFQPSPSPELSTSNSARKTASLPRKMVFQNFNTTPRKWTDFATSYGNKYT